MEFCGVKYSKVFVADMQILGSAFFFGIGFIGQRAVSVDGLGPMTCNTIRFALSTILLVICMPIMPSLTENIVAETSDDDDDNVKSANYDKKSSTSMETSTSYVISRLVGPDFIQYFQKAKKTVLFWGICLGCVNFFASGFQQWGIVTTSANKVAFIAGFDLFLTPILALFLPTFKRNGKPTPSTWIAVSISIFGLYLLSDANISDLEMGHGELLCLISTVFWTLHITYTDVATNYVDAMHMMCVQLTVVTVISGVFAIMTEPQGWFWHHILLFAPWMLFLAVAEGLGFTLMAMGQNFSPPTHAAIILSLEGVFASIASYFCLGETLSHREFVGCVLMLIATLVAKMGFFGIDKYLGAAQGHSSKDSDQLPLHVPSKSTSGSGSPVVNALVSALFMPFLAVRAFLSPRGGKDAGYHSAATTEITPDDVITGSTSPLMGGKDPDLLK